MLVTFTRIQVSKLCDTLANNLRTKIQSPKSSRVNNRFLLTTQKSFLSTRSRPPQNANFILRGGFFPSGSPPGGTGKILQRLKTQHNFNYQRKFIHTSRRNNALPPVIVVILGRIAKFGAMFLGRSVRRWWQKLPLEERAIYTKKVSRNRYIVSGILGAAAFGSFVFYERHVEETPFTNRRRFLAFSTDQIKEMAKLELEAHLLQNQKKIIPADAGLLVYHKIVQVAQRLLNGNQDLPQIHDLEWTVTVVKDEDQMNAFVLPCGSIFVFTGLLKICQNDDELGIILGHEMAHAIMGHGAEKASFLHFLDLMFVIPLAALWALLPTDITAAVVHWISATLTEILMELPHSRFIEEEADQVGLVLAAKSCFDIREAPVLWAKMRLIEEDDLSIEWLSTHPSHEKRQAQLTEMLPAAISLRETCKCPRLPVHDPRKKIEKFEQEVKKIKETKMNKLLVPVKVDANARTI